MWLRKWARPLSKVLKYSFYRHIFHGNGEHLPSQTSTLNGQCRLWWTEIDKLLTISKPNRVELFVLCLGPMNPPPGHCNFETGDCGYTQKKKAKKGHWLRIRGHTPTSYTGPKGDHTLGVGESNLCFSMKCFINIADVMRQCTLSLSCSDFKATTCTLRRLTCYPSSRPSSCPPS